MAEEESRDADWEGIGKAPRMEDKKSRRRSGDERERESVGGTAVVARETGWITSWTRWWPLFTHNALFVVKCGTRCGYVLCSRGKGGNISGFPSTMGIVSDNM